MQFFNNKFFILFLILAVVYFSFSVKTAEAGWFSKAFKSVTRAFSAFVNVLAASIAAIINIVVGISELIVGGITGVHFLSSDGNCRLSNITRNPFEVYADRCGKGDGGADGGAQGAGVGSGNAPLNCYQVPVTMYIPQLNGSGYNNQCAQPLDETQSQIAIYRYSIPNSSSQSTLNDWYLNQIKTKVGNGYLVNGYHTAATEEGKIAQLPYSRLCTGNVCKFTDDTVPDNSYVAYGAKIIGNYYKNEGGSCSWSNKFLNKDNAGSVEMPGGIVDSTQWYYSGASDDACTSRFSWMSTNQWGDWQTEDPTEVNTINYKIPSYNSGCGPYQYRQCVEQVDDEGNRPKQYRVQCTVKTYGLGNAFDGPYNIGNCPPKVDLKLNGADAPNPDDGPNTGLVIVNFPKTDAELKWTTQKVKDCVAESTDNLWTGSQAVSGTKDLGKLSRGTITPGQGKKYKFTLSCKSILDNSTITDSVYMTVKRVPNCSFAADPSIIEVLPATSTLSWDCRYADVPTEGADSCEIDQGIGSVDPLVGSKDVRPTQDTTYTLTCQGIDGDGNTPLQASVKVGFTPTIREIIPR